jgi:hypothetical protein
VWHACPEPGAAIGQQECVDRDLSDGAVIASSVVDAVRFGEIF